MVSTQHHFEVGQRVKWGDKHRFWLKDTIAKYGEGPFTIESVQTVPHQCANCDQQLASFDDRCQECGGKSKHSTVGHNQWVHILFAGETKPEIISGDHLIPVT